MQFKKVKKEIITAKREILRILADFIPKIRVFLQIERNVVQKSTGMNKF